MVFDELTIGNMTLQDVTAAVMGHEDSAEYMKALTAMSILIGFNQLESAYRNRFPQSTIKFEEHRRWPHNQNMATQSATHTGGV